MSLSEVPHDAAVPALLEQLEQLNSASAARPGERSRSLVDQAGDFLERIAELLPGKQRDVLAD